MALAVSRSFSPDTFKRSVTVLQPSASISFSVHAMASSGERVRLTEPLSAMSRWKYFWDPGISGSRVQLPAPADSPQMVTFSGSPPKPAMFSCTHFNAFT